MKHAVHIIANELSIPILYISTAGIFDGKNDIYDESSIPNPNGHYANSKYQGEKYVIENANDYLDLSSRMDDGWWPKKRQKIHPKSYGTIKKGA